MNFTNSPNEDILSFFIHSSKDEIERVGHLLSYKQFLFLLEAFSKKSILIDKLSPLLVGLPSHVFNDAISQAEPVSLEILKKEGLLEPLQHHINLLANTLEELNRIFQKDVIFLENEITSLETNNLSYEKLHLIENKIEELRTKIQDSISTLDKALAITWNTNRIDLIEKLTHLKELFHFHINHQIGMKGIEDHPTTGLYLELEQHLSKIYDTEGEEITFRVLKDEDLSIEGLAKLSLWYLKDYWDIGLLPLVKHAEDLELRGTHLLEKDKVQYRQNLFEIVQNNLNALGLFKIIDLKKRQIFSREMLKEYIEDHENELSYDHR